MKKDELVAFSTHRLAASCLFETLTWFAVTKIVGAVLNLR